MSTTKPVKPRKPVTPKQVAKATGKVAVQGQSYDARLDKIKLTAPLRDKLLREITHALRQGKHSAAARLEAEIYAFSMRIVEKQAMGMLKDHGSPFAAMGYQAFMDAMPGEFGYRTDSFYLYVGAAHGRALTVRHPERKTIHLPFARHYAITVEGPDNPDREEGYRLLGRMRALEENLRVAGETLRAAVTGCRTMGSFFSGYPDVAALLPSDVVKGIIADWEMAQASGGQLTVSPSKLTEVFAKLRVE